MSDNKTEQKPVSVSKICTSISEITKSFAVLTSK